MERDMDERKKPSKAGFSLVEVMIAMGLLAMIAMGISQNLILTRGIAETNIREVTANSVISGYLEQLKSMQYERILTSVRDTSKPLPTKLSEGQPDPLYLGQWMTKTVVIDEDKNGNVERTMPLHVHVEIEDLAGNGNGTSMAIEFEYAWEDARSGVRRDRSLRTMRSFVPTF
jgi:prepilin-type N-terminal cleavage/methylation domain-containing protein